MNEQAKYSAFQNKLENLCEKNNLVSRFNHDAYPITMSIRPLQGMYDQLSLLEAAEDGEGRISQDAVMMFIKRDGDISLQTFGSFVISDALQSKFKNLFKKLCECWEGFFFRSVIETKALRSGLMPVINEDEADDHEDVAAEDDPDWTMPEMTAAVMTGAAPSPEDAELVEKAVEIVRLENKCTTSLLQRKLGIGCAKAAYIIDILEQSGVVGPFKGAEPRDVLPVGEPEDGLSET